jgi:hypothetical protein
LLVLNPGEEDEPIHCYLEHHAISDLQDWRSFDALSYSWGPESESQYIYVDGKMVSVRQNLYSFLQAHRWHDCVRVIWADAICINQEDFEEKRQQIGLMKQIYESATRVVIWLGWESEDSCWAVQVLEQLYEEFWLPRKEALGESAFSPDDVPIIMEILEGRKTTKKECELTKERYDPPQPYDRALNGMQELFHRTFWSRTWVQQEATAPAEHRTIKCGRHIIDIEVLLAGNKIVSELAFGPLQVSKLQKYSRSELTYIEELLIIRRQHQANHTSYFLNLSTLLSMTKHLEASDSRDKLYSLIPMSLDGNEMIYVDYNSPVEDVYRNAAIAFIQKTRSLDILGHCHPNTAEDALRLPSWVPDWTSKFAPKHFYKRKAVTANDASGKINSGNFKVDGPLYSASKGSTTDIRIVRDDLNALFCQGFVFDAIQSVSPEWNKLYTYTTILHSWKEWLSSATSHQSTCDSYVGGGSIADAFAHAITSDSFMVGVDLALRGYAAELEHSTEVASPDDQNLSPYGRTEAGIRGIHPSTYRRKLIETKKGYIGISAEHVQPRDLVVILLGGQMPFILRKVDDHFVLVGEAYVHGIMDGEPMDVASENTMFEIR